MADEQNLATTAATVIVPTVTPVVAPVTPAVPSTPSTDDIITRASKFIDENKPVVPTEPVEFNSQELDKLIDGITDPAVKELLIKKSKSLESGFGRKFQELAEIRKNLTQAQSQPWTPERVRSALQDPLFVQSAQEVASSYPKPPEFSDEEYSQLNEVEKARVAKVPALEQELNVLKNERYLAQKQEQDTQLKAKYHNYDPKVIDTLQSDLISNRIQATREHLHKVVDYEPMAKRTYQLGYQDGLNENKERLSASSQVGSNIVPNSDVPKKEPGQTDKAHFLEIARRRLAESKQLSGAIK